MAISITTVKTLFALSRNTCYYRGCEEKLTDPRWIQVNADIAHIRGENPTAARFDIAMETVDRDAFDNLMLLCPGCHRLIDRLRPSDHSVELLREMKSQHEDGAYGPTNQLWADEQSLQLFARLLLNLDARDPRSNPKSLKDALSLFHWSQKDLAANIDYTATAVSNWVNGRSTPSHGTRVRLAEEFEVSLDVVNAWFEPSTTSPP